MKRMMLLLATSLASPALAQHAGHAAPAPGPAPAQPAAPACTPEHEAMGHCRMPAPAAPKAQACTPEHAAMGHCTLPPAGPAPEPAPAPGCTPEHAALGHCTMPAGPPPRDSDPHAGHVTSEETPGPPVALPPPGALSGPAHAADAVYGREAMAEAREALRKEHGSIVTSKVMLDRLEARIGKGRDLYLVEGEAWYGGDVDRLWLKAELEGDFGRRPGHAEVQALWSRAVSPWWNLQAGLRYDIRPDPERAQLVLGIEGLAPYWFEVEAAAFVSHKGEVTARFEAEHDQRLTRKLILQPRIELDLAARDVPERGIGSGLSNAEAGLRLRYEIVPELAPYVGVAYERAFGDTADFRRASGEKAGGWYLLAGVRAWF